MGTYDHNTPSPFPAHLNDRDFTRGFVRASDIVDRVAARLERINRTTNSNPDGHRLSFAELAERSPRLAELAAEIARLPRRRAGFCANAVWFGRYGYKARMSALVGWFAESPDMALATVDAYQIAYHTLYRRLPDCQHDGMCGWSTRVERD